MRTRDEHLEWAKEQARYYLDRGDVQNAITSIMSDLSKHPDFERVASKMTPLAMYYIAHGDVRDARNFVEGFR